VGVAEDANVKCRPSMEDRYVVCNPLPSSAGGGVFLGVFDGHGGAGCADFAADVIQHNFTNELKRAERKSLSIAEILWGSLYELNAVDPHSSKGPGFNPRP
jgi:serine/threonine protein phosphatase PrpC